MAVNVLIWHKTTGCILQVEK